MPAGILFGTEGGSGLLPLLRRMPPATAPAEIRHRPKSDTGEAAKNSPHGWQAVRGIV